MVFKVVWTGPARKELREIKNYIAADNPTAAKRVIREIEARVDQLETMPFGFPAYEPSRDENTRHMVVGNYRIFYRVYPGKTADSHSDRLAFIAARSTITAQLNRLCSRSARVS